MKRLQGGANKTVHLEKIKCIKEIILQNNSNNKEIISQKKINFLSQF